MTDKIYIFILGEKNLVLLMKGILMYIMNAKMLFFASRRTI